MNIEEAIAALQKAKDDYEVAEREVRASSGLLTTCTNRLNDAQKAFDAAVAEIRKAAPSNTDWARYTQRGQESA